MIYTYHFYAIHQEELGSVRHVDGIADLSARISTKDLYLSLKEQIAVRNNTFARKIAICSLTLLSVRSESNGEERLTP